MKYYLALIIKNEVLTHAIMWKNIENIMLSDISKPRYKLLGWPKSLVQFFVRRYRKTQRNFWPAQYYMIRYMKYLKKKKKSYNENVD